MTEAVMPGELESARITGILRKDIILGRRAPGARLVERDIAAELNVSRVPVREAIKALVAEGVVVSRPRTWATVRRFTMQDIQDFGEVREVVETMTFVLAARRHDAAGLERLNAVLARESTAAHRGDYDTARLAAGEFHELVAELAGNKMLNEVIGVFVTRVKWLFGQDDLPAVLEEHGQLLEAIRARDEDTLRVMVPEHLAAGQEFARRRLAATSA